MNILMEEVGWKTRLENLSTFEMSDVLLKEIEEGTKKVFKPKEISSTTPAVNEENHTESDVENIEELKHPNVKSDNLSK